MSVEPSQMGLVALVLESATAPYVWMPQRNSLKPGTHTSSCWLDPEFLALHTLHAFPFSHSEKPGSSNPPCAYFFTQFPSKVLIS